jgi:competence protein ComEC
MLTAAIVSRKPNGLNVLFGAGWLMCAVDASTLFDLGFQLSFSAVGGILTLEKKLRTSMELKSFIPRKLWEMSSVSIAAQIGTMPVALFYFHQFPLYFLPANLIIVPLSTLILYGGIISFILTRMGFQFNIIKEIVAFLLNSMNILARTFSDLPYSVMDEIYLDVIELCCFTICVILIIRFLLWKSQRAVLMTAVALIIIEINSHVDYSYSKPMPSEIPYRESKVLINNLGDTLIYSLPHDITLNKNLIEKIKRFSSKDEHKIILIKSQKFQHDLGEYVPQ